MHIGKNGLSLMIPEGATLEEHARVARTLAHPFTSPPLRSQRIYASQPHIARQIRHKPIGTEQ